MAYPDLANLLNRRGRLIDQFEQNKVNKMNNHNHSHNEPRLDENPEPRRSQTSGRVAASARWRCRYSAASIHTRTGVSWKLRTTPEIVKGFVDRKPYDASTH
jgi:hypothetical protein